MSGTELEIPETLDANPPPEEAAERPLSPREEMMAGIVARRQAQIDSDNAQAAIYDADAREAGLNFPEDEPEQTDSSPAPQVARTVAPEPRIAPPATQNQTPALQHRTVTIDGQQFAVTDAQADQLMRLGMMANVALHQYQQPTQSQAAPLQEQPRPIIDDERLSEAVRQIQYGGEDGAREALRGLITDVIARVPQQQIDPNAIVQQAITQTRAQTQLDRDAELIRQEYPDIFADPQRTMLAKLNVDAIRARDVATGARRSDLDIYREAGNAVYAALGKALPGAVEQPQRQQSVRQDVIERKRAAPRATQHVDMRAPAPPQQRAPTGSDVVDQIRLARGQPSMR